MGCRLGECRADAYRVVIRERGFGSKPGAEIAELDFTQLDWERNLNAVSEATAQIPPRCCGKLAKVWPWRHEMAISRDGDEQWTGAIRAMPNCTSGITIQARDVLMWLDDPGRVIHNNHDWSASNIGAVQAAIALIQDGYEPDDPYVLKFLTGIGTGVIGGWNYPANSNYVLAALVELAKGGIDFTAIGRRIVVMPSGYQLGRTALLTCDHFQGDLCVTADGTGYFSKAVVTGTGVTGTAGGLDPYFGLVEKLQDNDAIGRQSTADSIAAGMLNGKNRVPELVQPPQGNGLAPDAPVCLKELVPGVVVPVSINCTCRTATQDMRLTQLKVSVSAEGETVTPQLSPIGFDTSE